MVTRFGIEHILAGGEEHTTDRARSLQLVAGATLAEER